MRQKPDGRVQRPPLEGQRRGLVCSVHQEHKASLLEQDGGDEHFGKRSLGPAKRRNWVNAPLDGCFRRSDTADGERRIETLLARPGKGSAVGRRQGQDREEKKKQNLGE